MLVLGCLRDPVPAGVTRIDVSRRGGSVLGTPWELQRRFEEAGRSDVAWAQFHSAWMEHARQQWRTNPRFRQALLGLVAKLQDLTQTWELACYCQVSARCHRAIVLELAQKLTQKGGAK